MATLFGFDHKMVAITTICLSAGVSIYTSYRLWKERQRQREKNLYETEKLVSEYLVLHYGKDAEILSYDFGLKESLHFPKRCAELCIKHFKERDGIPSRAFDIGCAVGCSSFELAKTFDAVIGLDYSQAFVDVCNRLRVYGCMQYNVQDEGDLQTLLIAGVDDEVDRSRTTFIKGDACSLPSDLGQFGCVLAANLICRLHSPMDFLERLPGLVASGGILVITSPYTWMEQFTDKSKWIGGYYDKKKRPVSGFQALQKKLGPDFDLIEEKNMPFFIRETAHKNQWTIAHATVWRRK
ncbi:hypothetical protein CHS0354_013802 [Potamilus streckersoni]|uniref:Methyltransferase type 11 domain-containing protein n=1 Tax=Potamilus streckersoni TaxID=2493646 RepID=A0AAE0SH60_9BIVA|nr:hypothetical protein CHS0354_013802 [Potamilus streckersoni]